MKLPQIGWPIRRRLSTWQHPCGPSGRRGVEVGVAVVVGVGVTGCTQVPLLSTSKPEPVCDEQRQFAQKDALAPKSCRQEAWVTELPQTGCPRGLKLSSWQQPTTMAVGVALGVLEVGVRLIVGVGVLGGTGVLDGMPRAMGMQRD